MVKQTALIYAFVARGNVILADYTDFSGNFNDVAYQGLQKLPTSNNKFTYNCDGHTFNYLVDNGFTYCVVAEESVGRQVPMAFLDRIKEDFVAKYGGGKAAAAPPNSLSKEFGPKLKEHMKYCADNPDEISKIVKVKAQVSEVKGVMMDNIEKWISCIYTKEWWRVDWVCGYVLNPSSDHWKFTVVDIKSDGLTRCLSLFTRIDDMDTFAFVLGSKFEMLLFQL